MDCYFQTTSTLLIAIPISQPYNSIMMLWNIDTIKQCKPEVTDSAHWYWQINADFLMHCFCHLSTWLTVYKKHFSDPSLTIANVSWQQRTTEANRIIPADDFQCGKKFGNLAKMGPALKTVYLSQWSVRESDGGGGARNQPRRCKLAGRCPAFWKCEHTEIIRGGQSDWPGCFSIFLPPTHLLWKGAAP